MLEILSTLRWQDLVDVTIISVAIYYLFKWTSNHKAKQLLNGVFIIMVFYAISYFLQLFTVSWLMQKLTTIVLLIFIIVFQPELRQLLEKLGRSTQLRQYFMDKKENEDMLTIQMVQNLVKVIEYFSENRIGSIIVIEQINDLEHIKDTGIELKAEFSAELLVSIFYGRNPLHDGAVIIQGNTIVSASCLLPLTQSKLKDRTIGTRHRAALGLAEITDAIVLVTSEETGIISMAINGKLYRRLSRKKLQEHLLVLLQLDEQEGKKPDSFFNNVADVLKDLLAEK
ncbi:MAG: diadenylate cyclase CdaA [Candidatus Margulisbacteria bacterium]|nr:diadenylate cyclase CdaA [Candidatus Margulisiibacteriota bacterium]